MGFTPIDNALFELLPVLKGNELKIMLAIIRQTTGWHKETTALTYRDISILTGIPLHNLTRDTESLIEKGYLKRFRRAKSLVYRTVLHQELSSKTKECYQQHTPEDCTFITKKIVEPQCIQCPRYLLKKA